MFDSRCPAARVGASDGLWVRAARGSTTGRSVCFAGHSLLGLASVVVGNRGGGEGAVEFAWSVNSVRLTL